MQPIERFADGKILAGRIDNIGVLLFNHPERRNAINVEMWDGLARTLDLFSADDSIRVVIYAGTDGKAFVSGGDIRRMSGVEALNVGLADLIAPADHVVQETVALARTIVDNAPLSVSAAKFTIGQIVKDASDRDLPGVAQWGRRCFDSADYHEGHIAFMAKRPPVFTGR